MPQKSLSFAPLALLPLLLFALPCGGRSGAERPDLAPPGASTTAEAKPAGAARPSFAALTQRVRDGEFGEIHSFLVYRGGELLAEEYFHGYDANRLHEIQSVTKSVTSLLVGIAIDQGKIRGIDQKFLDFFPDRPIANRDARKEAITLKDVLTMSSGLDWDEHDAPYGSPQNTFTTMYGRPDWIQYVLDRPMAHNPGEVFRYNSGAAISLSAVLTHATGMKTQDFARKALFDPLGVEAEWKTSTPEGLAHTGGGLNLTPRGLAKIGLLVLAGGQWQGRQIVSESWIRQATTRHLRNVRPDNPIPLDYGYLWWFLSLDAPGRRPAGDLLFGWGADGQFLFILPQLNAVVVTTAGNADQDFLSVNLLTRGVLPLLTAPAAKAGAVKPPGG